MVNYGRAIMDLDIIELSSPECHRKFQARRNLGCPPPDLYHRDADNNT